MNLGTLPGPSSMGDINGAGLLPIGRFAEGIVPVPSRPLFERYEEPEYQRAFKEYARSVERGDTTADLGKIMSLLANVERAGITAGTYVSASGTNIPVRENLDAEVVLLVPAETPLRARLPRIPGSGAAASWEQATSFGGGYALTSLGTAITTVTDATHLVVGSTTGMTAGDTVMDLTPATPVSTTITTVTDATHLVVGSTTGITAGDRLQDINPAADVIDQPGAGVGALQSFFSELGAPAMRNTTYTRRNKNYTLMGALGQVSVFAMAAGASFQNQYQAERRNGIINLCLIEENALMNSVSTDVNPPWGNGVSALGYDGLIPSIATINGTPGANLVNVGGPLTLDVVDAMLKAIWIQGGRNPYIICNGIEQLSFTHLATASGTAIRFIMAPQEAILGAHVKAYMHPISGQPVPIETSRFCPAGTMIFGSENGPFGQPAADVSVLPQVQLPELAPNTQFQGYTAQELPPSITSPQGMPFLVSVFSVFRLKAPTVFGKLTGLSAV